MTIMLWTWQGLDFDPLSQRVDRSKSRFLTNPPPPDIQRAYEELDELLCLPQDRKGQYLWCYTTDSWVKHPWNKRLLWPMDVPQDSILAYIDDRVWEHLIGSKWVPSELLEQWRDQLDSQEIDEEQFNREISRRQREYHDSFPAREVCLETLLSPNGPGEAVSALVRVPIDVSWIRPYDLRGRGRQ